MGAVVVVTLERAAAVGCKRGASQGVLRVAVKVPAENSLEVVVAEAVEQRVGVDRTICHAFAERKMSEKHQGPGAVEAREVVVHPMQGGVSDGGFIVARALGGIQSDKLPAFVGERVVEAAGKNRLIGGSVGRCEVIVITDLHVHRFSKTCENIPDDGKVVSIALFNEITGVETKIRRLGFDAGDNVLQPRAALGAHIMRIVDHREGKHACGRGGAGGAQRSGPKPESEQSAGAEGLQSGATGKDRGFLG